MSFPTTSVLDNFTRDDEDPLSDDGNWGTPIWEGDGKLKLVSDEVTATDPTNYCDQVWGTSISGDTEAWATLEGADGYPYVAACLTGTNGNSVSGYEVGASATALALVRLDGGDSTSLTTHIVTLGVGDSIGLSVSDGTVEMWYKPADGDWSMVGSASDDTYSSGVLGIGYNGNSGTVSSFTSFGGTPSGDDDGTAPAAGRAVPRAPKARRGLLLSAADLTGAPLLSGSSAPVPVQTPDQPQVTIPLSDSRTGQLAVSMYEPIAGALEAGTTVVKVLYINPKGDEVLLLNGIVLNPEEDYDEATVTCTLHDHTIRLKKRYLGYNHASIELANGDTVGDGDAYSETVLDDVGLGMFYGINSDYGQPIDGMGLRLLLLDTSHGAADWPGGGFTGDEYVPSMGIRYGVDNANRQPVYGALGVPPSGVTGWTATTVEGSDTLTDVNLSAAVWTDDTAGTPTWADLVEYAALTGAGMAEFAQILSTDEGASTITMSQPATADGTAVALTSEDAIYAQLERGDCVYDDWTAMVQEQGGFECDFIPVDKNNLGFSGATWESGQFIELYTANRVGTDRSQSQTAVTPVMFVHGQGGCHITAGPDADSLITYETQVGPGGPWDPLDIRNKVTMISDTAQTYGIWEDWEQNTTAGTGDTPISNTVLKDRAEAVLTGYQNPPKFLTITLDIDRIGKYCYGTDFFLGDTVTAFAKRGYRTFGPLDVRITNVGVTQIDHDGNCQLVMQAVPYLTSSPGLSDGD